MKTEIIVAVIAAIASVAVAYIPIMTSVENTAKQIAASEAKSSATVVVNQAKIELIQQIQKLDVVTAGSVQKNGTVVRHAGYPFTVAPRDSGRYRINFRDPSKQIPTVVAISDGGDKGAFAEITAIDTTGFTVEGRTYSGHGLAKIGFQFVAVQSTSK